MTVVRNVAPLALFGKETYATMSGRLNLPLNIVFAMSPMVFAFVTTPFSHDERHQRRIDMLAAYQADGSLPPLAESG